MDVVLTLRHAGEPRTEGLFSAAGIERLGALFAWLAEHGSAGDLYVVVPHAAADAIAPMTQVASFLAPLVAGKVHVVLEARSASAGVLASFAAARIADVVVRASLERDEDTLLLGAVADFRAPGAQEPAELRVWLEADADPFRLARIAAFEAAGVRRAAIVTPPLPVPEDVVPPVSLPPELREGGLLCELYANALTIDADGDVRPCTRYATGGRIGNLLEDDFAELVARKGRMFQSVMSSGPCQTCTAAGRFRWATGEAPALATMFTGGALDGDSAAAGIGTWWT